MVEGTAAVTPLERGGVPTGGTPPPSRPLSAFEPPMRRDAPGVAGTKSKERRLRSRERRLWLSVAPASDPSNDATVWMGGGRSTPDDATLADATVADARAAEAMARSGELEEEEEGPLETPPRPMPAALLADVHERARGEVRRAIARSGNWRAQLVGGGGSRRRRLAEAWETREARRSSEDDVGESTCSDEGGATLIISEVEPKSRPRGEPQADAEGEPSRRREMEVLPVSDHIGRGLRGLPSPAAAGDAAGEEAETASMEPIGLETPRR